MLHDADAAAATFGGRGFRAVFHAPNRTEYRARLLEHLEEEQSQHAHLFLNLSREGMYLITKGVACRPRDVPHAPAFLSCIGRLFTTPEPHSRLAAALAAARATVVPSGAGGGAPARPPYVGVHVRTFGVDMGLPLGTAPDAEAALEFYAWEVRVNASEYAAAARVVCRNSTGRSLWVASDSRAAALLWARLCPGKTHTFSVDAARVHSERGHGAAAARAVATSADGGGGHEDAAVAGMSGSDVLLLDWLMLASAHAVVRWGAQHSSFAASAHTRSCGGRLWRSPKSFQYKAAASWLLSKVRLYLSMGGRQNASWDCASPIAKMLRTTPCRSGCLRECRRLIYGAFA